MSSVLVALAAAGLSAFAPAAAPTGPAGSRTPVPGVMELSGRLIARPIRAGLRAPADAPARAARARAALAPAAIAHFPQTDEFVVPVPPGETDAAAIARLMATGDYEYVTSDWICYPVDEPSDPLYSSQWHHRTLASAQAWEVTQGSSQIVCAFVDTGVDVTHPDLAPRLVLGFNAVNDLPQDFGGDITDVNGHGTAVAGTAAAIGNNGVGVAGIGWNLWIMPIRVSNAPGGGAYMSDILQGARWAADNGARVVSASYSGVADPAVQSTGEYIRGLNASFLFAAGNNAANLAFEYPDVLVVGATTAADDRAGFSGYGQAVDLVAPGVDVYTTQRGGGYGPSSGTSFATPMANGVLGMILSANPALTAPQAEAILLASCDDLGAAGEDDLYGNGRVNLLRAVSQSAATLGPAAPYAVPDRVTAIMGSPRRIDVLANDFDITGEAIQLVSVAASAGGGTAAVSVGSGPSGRDEILYTPPAEPGPMSLTYVIRDASGMEDTGVVHVTVLDPSTFLAGPAPAASRPGVLARYYALSAPAALPDFAQLTPYASELLPEVNFPSTDGPFAGSGRNDDVGAVIEGFVHIAEPDLYTFSVASDDGSRLLIGSTVVADNDGLHGMQERSGSVGLLAGWHPIRVEFFEAGGGAGLLVSIEGASLSKRVIPAAMFREAACPGDWDGQGGVNSADISAYLARWLADLGQTDAAADVNGDGAANSADISAFLSAWLANLGGGC